MHRAIHHSLFWAGQHIDLQQMHGKLLKAGKFGLMLLQVAGMDLWQNSCWERLAKTSPRTGLPLKLVQVLQLLEQGGQGKLTLFLLIFWCFTLVIVIVWLEWAVGTIVALGSLMRSSNMSGAGMECLDRNSITWLSGMVAVDSILSLGIRKVVLCGIFSCTILMSMTKVK